MSYHISGNNGFYLAYFHEKCLRQCAFHFWLKIYFLTQNHGMSIDFICPNISQSLSVIWHVNCVWLFDKCLQQSFLLNKQLFTKIVIFLPKIIDLWTLLLVISRPKYILTHAKKQRFYRAWFSEKNSWQSSLVKWSTFHKKCHIFTVHH